MIEYPPRRFPLVLSEEQIEQRAMLFRALAEPTRLHIISILRQRASGVCVVELVESLDVEQPTISHHLVILRIAGLITREKHGTYRYYHLCQDAFARAASLIQELAQD